MTEEIKFLEKFYRNIQNKIPGDYVACRVGLEKVSLCCTS